ncbi:RYamide receptor-like [Adelges cooleyi]|uniref:RYamide receptor-like n=1 Tax=Adelges cooleyi TaxID=133065 RepID=UPI00217F9E27|nr:RYamide receptor-like [Adelges cooleyi]
MIMPEVVNVSSIDEVSSWNVSDIVTDISCQMKPYEETLGSVVFKSIAFAIGMLVIVTALVGNGLVCIVITSSTQTISVINTLILNIAISDMIIPLFYFPYLVNVIFMNYWPFGEALCDVYSYLNTVVIQVSTYTMVAISINRYVAVIWPLKTRASKQNGKSIIFLVWTLSAVTSVPFLFANGLQQPSIWYKSTTSYKPIVSMSTWDHRAPFCFMLYWLGMSHTCHNPVIYCCMNNEFRKELVPLLRKMPLLGRCLCRVNTSVAEAIPLQAKHCQSDRSSSRR